MPPYAADDPDVPWGKYTYALEGLASRCYLEGAAAHPPRPNAPPGRRLRFRVDLPARCFVLSVAVKLPYVPESVLPALNDIAIERTLSNGDYELVYDGYDANRLAPNEQEPSPKKDEPRATPSTVVDVAPGKPSEKPAFQAKPLDDADGDVDDNENDNGDKDNNANKNDETRADSPTSVDHTAANDDEDAKSDQPPPRKKVMEVRRAADSLRLTITDMDDDEPPKSSPQRRRRSSDSDDAASDTADLRTLGIVVVGYVRGQTPAANRIKILLNSSARLGVNANMADKAEVDGLLGLAFLGNRRYRQAAELLQRASELTVCVANADAKAGCAVDDAFAWAAELNLLSAHAFFEHMPMSNDGIVRLVQVAATAKGLRPPLDASPRDVRDLETEFLDLRTELLSMLEGLLTALVKFLSESNSLAVKMASSRMIEFISEQLGCAIARHMAGILDQVLRSYPTCTTFGARERAAAASFSYDSMEDCFERLIDICCRLFPLTEHSVLKDLFEKTLIPVFMEVFQESDYLSYDADADEEADEMMPTAVAQGLRVIYLVVSILGVDANVPPSLVTRVLNILIPKDGSPRTTLLLRRTALHTWDAIAQALKQSAYGNTIASFGEHIKVLRDYIPKLLVDTTRPGFEYGDLEHESDPELEIVKEEYLVPGNSQVLQDVLKKRRRRIEVVDRHTLGRLLALIREVCNALELSDEDEVSLQLAISLQDMLGCAIADLLMSSLVDVSYHEAVASGNGPHESNNLYEFGDIKSQLKVVAEVLDELFESYWAVLSLLPVARTTECVRYAPIRAVLGWCVDRMSHSAPPKGMLKLLFVASRGLQHELNTPMYKLPAVPASAHEVTFISIHRAHLQWFPQSVHEEAFDLMDVLNEAVAEDLMAKDLALLIHGLGDQGEKFQARTEASLELLASIVALSVPKRADLAVSSLRALVDPSLGKQRISNGFPKLNRSNTGSFTRRMQFTSSTPKADSMAKSLYIHVVLASCFDRFDALGRAAKKRGGPSYMGEKIDAFVEHAALAVRCLHACARARTHREYVGAVLGDIFGTCLAMQDHGDGRVRLAGFEIFAASLDVLFLAQKAMVLVPSQGNNGATEASVFGTGSVPSTTGVGVAENANGITELSSSGERDAPVGAATTTQAQDRVDSGALTSAGSAHKVEDIKEPLSSNGDKEGLEAQLERRMQEIYAEGGSCAFHGEDTSASQLAFEERGWQMLCAFITSSLGIGKYVDFVVQRACLEYLKGCMLNALRGRSTGASVIAFEHIEPLWDAVNRLVGSPWRTLNALALWVVCAILDVAIYSSIMAKGRGVARQRTAQLNEFVLSQVFPRAEELLKSDIRETRVWGMRLLESYIRARELNGHVVQAVPAPPGRLLRCLDNLKHDWDDEVRERSQSLLEIHFNSINKKSNSQMQSFTRHATTFMSMNRHHDDGYEGSDSSKIELWFPPLPKQMQVSQMEAYCRTLEAFANTEIIGGEETELIGAAEENDRVEDAYNDGYEDDEEAYEFEDEKEDGVQLVDDESEQGLEVAADEEHVNADGTPDGDGGVEFADSAEFGGSEGDEEIEEDLAEQAIPAADLAFVGDLIPQKDTPESDGGMDGEQIADGEGKEFIEEDVIEDDEFSTGTKGTIPVESGPLLFTQVSDNDDDDFAGVAVRIGSSDDDVEEEEVVDVTDEEDVLADLDSVGHKLVSSHDSREDSSFGLGGDGGASARRSAISRLSLNLNPDLDEGVQVLRRKGSFTSRSSSGIPLEEGDAPRLARRRSHEVSSVASIIGVAQESKRDEGESSPGGSRMRRKPFRTSVSSPRAADSADSSRSRPTENSVERQGSNEKESSGPVLGNSRLNRRKSDRMLLPSGGEPDQNKSSDDSKEALVRRSPRSRDAVVGGAFLSLSPKGSRIPRGIKLDDEDEMLETRPRPSGTDRSASGESGRGRTGESKFSGSRPNRRSLPRAPAFVKGGSLQRRQSGGLPNISARLDSKPGGVGSGTGASGSNSSGSHSASSIPTSGGRAKLPRSRSQASKEGGPQTETRPDRSHRFSKREPLNLPFGDETDEFDKDLLGDMDPSFDMDDALGSQMRVGTPTAEALNGRNSLADDGPNSGYSRRRGSNRNVFDSLHYKGLLDQIGTPASDDSPRSGGSGSSRELDAISPNSASRKDWGVGRKGDAEKPSPSAPSSEKRGDSSS